MTFLDKVSYRCLYRIWGGLYALTAVLGLVFPDVEQGGALAVLRLVTVGFFLPPWMILAKARREEARFHIRLLRYLSAAWLALVLAFFCASILTVGQSEALGNFLHIAMTVVCAPLVCSHYYVLPMFLWATILVTPVAASGPGSAR